VDMCYMLQRTQQTLAFARRERAAAEAAAVGAVGVADALGALAGVRDLEGPLLADTWEEAMRECRTGSLAERAFLAAEALRLLFPAGAGFPEWLPLVGLLHPLGMLLHHDATYGAPFWLGVGESHPVGCAFDAAVYASSLFTGNPDHHPLASCVHAVHTFLAEGAPGAGSPERRGFWGAGGAPARAAIWGPEGDLVAARQRAGGVAAGRVAARASQDGKSGARASLDTERGSLETQDVGSPRPARGPHAGGGAPGGGVEELARCGPYRPGCGLGAVAMSWGPCEYLDVALGRSGSALPAAARWLLRHQRFESLGAPGGGRGAGGGFPGEDPAPGPYQHLLSGEDEAAATWLVGAGRARAPGEHGPWCPRPGLLDLTGRRDSPWARQLLGDVRARSPLFRSGLHFYEDAIAAGLRGDPDDRPDAPAGLRQTVSLYRGLLCRYLPGRAGPGGAVPARGGGPAGWGPGDAGEALRAGLPPATLLL